MSNRLFYDRGGGGYGRAWAQRWLNGHQTWAVPGPRFYPSGYGVAHVIDSAARAFSTQHHYRTSWVASTRRRYGLFDITATPAHLVGIAVMAIPPNKLVLTNTFPTLEPYEESLVLARLVLLDEVPWSAESLFMGEVCRLAAADGLRGVVMDSDPDAPVQAGRARRHGEVHARPGVPARNCLHPAEAKCILTEKVRCSQVQ